MRTEGPWSPAVASAIASGCGWPAASASRYQRRNSVSGSAGAFDSSRGMSRRLGGGFLRHVFPELLERRPLKARDVHLADAEPARDLRLRHLLVEPHGHDRPLAGSQMLHRAIQHVTHLDAVELGIRPADLL